MTQRFDFKTASRSQLECIWKAIAEETGDDRFFTTKELDILPRELAPFEQVLSFSSGNVDGNSWLIVLTDQRIILLDKGMFFGLKQISIELSRINSFEAETGLVFGSIKIGSNARNYEINTVWKKTVNPFTMKLREAQRAREDRREINSPGAVAAIALNEQAGNEAAPSPAAPTPISTPSVQATSVGNLPSHGYAERLLAAGAINQQRYQELKRQG